MEITYLDGLYNFNGGRMKIYWFNQLGMDFKTQKLRGEERVSAGLLSFRSLGVLFTLNEKERHP